MNKHPAAPNEEWTFLQITLHSDLDPMVKPHYHPICPPPVGYRPTLDNRPLGQNQSPMENISFINIKYSVGDPTLGKIKALWEITPSSISSTLRETDPLEKSRPCWKYPPYTLYKIRVLWETYPLCKIRVMWETLPVCLLRSKSRICLLGTLQNCKLSSTQSPFSPSTFRIPAS